MARFRAHKFSKTKIGPKNGSNPTNSIRTRVHVSTCVQRRLTGRHKKSTDKKKTEPPYTYTPLCLPIRGRNFNLRMCSKMKIYACSSLSCLTLHPFETKKLVKKWSPKSRVWPSFLCLKSRILIKTRTLFTGFQNLDCTVRRITQDFGDTIEGYVLWSIPPKCQRLNSIQLRGDR